MNAKVDNNFEQFASFFVSAYWMTVKEGTFSIPPDGPVEESLEDLIPSVSFVIESRALGVHQFLMTGEAGDWWRFGFNHKDGCWKLVSASARADRKNSPHDLLGEVYAPYFRPFLEHVADKANKSRAQSKAHQLTTAE